MKTKFLAFIAVTPLLFSCNAPTINVDIDGLKDFTPEYSQPANKNVGNPATDASGNVLFDFYEISDFHGACTYEEDDQMGLARMGYYFDKMRENNPGGTVLISGGDMFQGSADSNLTRGNLVTYGMNVMQFDAMTMGNHEFDWGEEWIIDNESRANFPFLAANLYLKGTTNYPDFIDPYVILERGEYKIGVIGTISEKITNTILAGAISGYDFASEIDIVDNLAAELRNDYDCDLVIWSTHYGYDSVATEVGTTKPDVDAIFAAHTHTTYTGTVQDIPIAETTSYGEAVAHIQLAYNPTSGETSVVTNEVDENPLATATSEDSTIASIYDQYISRFVSSVKDVVVGSVAEEFSVSRLANFAAKAMLEETLPNYSDQYNIVAAFHNVNGGVRTTFDAGTITYGKVYEAFPFDNEICILEITGTQLKRQFSSTSNLTNYHTIQTSDIVDSDKYYILSTDFLSTGSNPQLGRESMIVEYTKTYVRDAVTNQFITLCGTNSIGCASNSLSPDDYTGDNFR